MIKKIILGIGLLFSAAIFAQEGTASPYSFYGIGDVKFKGTAETSAMGGLGVYPDSIHLNLQNPASYASLKLTTLALGGSYKQTTFKTNTQTENARRSQIDYMVLGIPMGKFGAVIGLMPFSSVGYKIKTINETAGSKNFKGNGDINKIFMGGAYKYNQNWSFGLDLNYHFGQIETTNEIFLDNIQYGTRELNTSSVSGLNINTGVSFTQKIKNKYDFFGSFTFTPESNLKLTNTRKIATVKYSTITDGIPIDENDIAVANTTVKLPNTVAIGAGFGVNKKWMVGSEINLQSLNNFGNRFTDISNVGYENAKKYSIGGFYIPKYNSFTNYFDRIVYRAGLRFENTGLVISNQSITDKAVTVGLGLPVGGRLSNINFSAEFGQRGTTTANLIEENYINFRISLSLSDLWFVKSKYD